MSALPPPGVDPVADHGWCCTHPEQWRYFRPDAEARMLSALGAIFRVDPVETEFLLDLAEWAATEAALPVVQRLVASGDLAPKLAGRAASLRERLRPPGGVTAAVGPLDGADNAALVERLHHTREAAHRERIADELARRARDARDVTIACELLGERHPAGASLMRALVAGVERSALTEEQRAIAALACAASGLQEAMEPLVALLDDGRPMDTHDLYEVVKAFATDPPLLGDSERSSLVTAVHRCLVPSGSMDRARALVIDAMLLGTGAARRVAMASLGIRLRPLTRGERTGWRRSLAEASGWIDTPGSVRRLATLACSEERSVRSEAMRALRRLGTPAASGAALRGVARMVRAIRPALDIDGAEAIHTALDLLVRVPAKGTADVLAHVLRTAAFDGHGVQARAAIALAQLDDPRCLRPHRASGLPALVAALLLPLPVTPGRARTGELFDAGVAWLERYSAQALVADDAPNEHLRRVHTSRRILAWSDTSGRRSDT